MCGLPEMMVANIFAIVSMVRITAVAKVSMRKIRKLQFWPTNTSRKTLCLPLEKFENIINVIYTLCAMLEMMV